jgi:catechol 2,3-dioxygenase-like lactoylglutathione lyase family enzyme
VCRITLRESRSSAIRHLQGSMNIRDSRTIKAQVVSGLWLTAKTLMGFLTVMALITGWALIRLPGGLRPDSPARRHPFVFGVSFVTAVTIVIVAAVRWLKSPAKIMRIPGSIYLPVRNLDAASEWYRDKLGCQDVPPYEEDEPGTTAALALEKESGVLTLGLIDPQRPGTGVAEPSVPTLYAHNINKAREWLVSRGAAAGPLQRDQQRTQYFELRDLDGNLLEVSEEP